MLNKTIICTTSEKRRLNFTGQTFKNPFIVPFRISRNSGFSYVLGLSENLSKLFPPLDASGWTICLKIEFRAVLVRSFSIWHLCVFLPTGPSPSSFRVIFLHFLRFLKSTFKINESGLLPWIKFLKVSITSFHLVWLCSGEAYSWYNF